MKKTKKRNTARTPDISGEGSLDCTPLFAAFKEALDWALDIGAQLARDYPEEVEAVERVRRYIHKRIAGEPAHVKIEDILFTFGLIIGAIERDFGPISTSARWFGGLPLLRFPSADEIWERVVPRRATGLSVRIRPVHFETT